MTADGSQAPSQVREPDVAVIVVSWNTRDLLERAVLSALQQQPDGQLRVYVVDNASSDGSGEMVAQRFPEARVMQLAENLGFGRANNLAIEQTDEPYILLLNSDAELRLGAVAALRAEMLTDPKAGAVGARLVYPDGRWQSSVFSFPSLRKYTLELLGVSDALTSSVHHHDGEQCWMSGACLLLRRSALQHVGVFDPAFHMYSEEMDLCRRLWSGGWTVRYCSEAVAAHSVGQSVRHRHIEQPRLLWESRLRYHRKHHTAREAAALAGLVSAAYLGRCIVWGVRGLMSRTRDRRRWLDRARSAWLLARDPS